MILIFGGAYQGKLVYTLEHYGLTENDVFHCSDENATMPENKMIINGIDRWVLALIRAGRSVQDEVCKLIENMHNAIIICNDISCGVVPVDEELRMWREAVVVALTALASASKEVIRLFCGIPTKIK